MPKRKLDSVASFSTSSQQRAASSFKQTRIMFPVVARPIAKPARSQSDEKSAVARAIEELINDFGASDADDIKFSDEEDLKAHEDDQKRAESAAIVSTRAASGGKVERRPSKQTRSAQRSSSDTTPTPTPTQRGARSSRAGEVDRAASRSEQLVRDVTSAADSVLMDEMYDLFVAYAEAEGVGNLSAKPKTKRVKQLLTKFAKDCPKPHAASAGWPLFEGSLGSRPSLEMLEKSFDHLVTAIAVEHNLYLYDFETEVIVPILRSHVESGLAFV